MCDYTLDHVDPYSRGPRKSNSQFYQGKLLSYNAIPDITLRGLDLTIFLSVNRRLEREVQDTMFVRISVN